mmetsp:Transcript_3680/g.8515  ORF Transcript_3680/g.8515 Transcript_3680/m.8515 type:complete len:239 (-) Transcript_3680:987-1703(-)
MLVLVLLTVSDLMVCRSSSVPSGRLPRLARLATCSRKQRAENPSMRTLHWSAVMAVMSTVRLGKMRAKDLCALAASHFCRRIGVPVYMGLSGSGLHACRTSVQVLRSSFGGRLELDGSPRAGFQLSDRPSVWTCRMRSRDLHHRDRPCLTTVMPDRSRATKHRTMKSDALVHPVAGLKVGRYIGIRTSPCACVCVAVEREALLDMWPAGWLYSELPTSIPPGIDGSLPRWSGRGLPYS